MIGVVEIFSDKLGKYLFHFEKLPILF